MSLKDNHQHELYGDLHRVANDYEADMLGELAEKAGYVWRCKAGCNYRNWKDRKCCDNCAHPKGTVRCPDCGSLGPHEDNGEKGYERAYLCKDCRQVFDEEGL